MGFFDKFKKKKDDDFGMGDDPFGNTLANDPMQDPMGQGLANDPMADPGSGDPYGSRASSMNDPMGANFAPDPSEQPRTGNYPTQTARFPGQQPTQGPPQQGQYYDDQQPSRDVELILAKLDAIKAELDSVHQRVKKLEQASDQQAQQHQKKYAW